MDFEFGLLTSVVQIVIAVVTAAALGLSEVFDYNSETQSRAFDSAQRQRRYSSATLVLGTIISCVLVVLLIFVNPKGLLDEKTWVWLLLLYLFARRWNANRKIDHICEKFTEFALQCPVCYHFGFSAPLSEEQLRYLQDERALQKFDHGSEDALPGSLALQWKLNVKQVKTERSTVYVTERRPQRAQTFHGKRGLVVARNLGGVPYRTNRSSICFFVTRNYSQRPGNALWFPDGSDFRDQVIREMETTIEERRKHGLQEVAVAASWALLSLLFHPMRLADHGQVMRELSKPERRSRISSKFLTPGWERLRMAAARHAAEVSGSEAGLANHTAAVAHSMVHGNFEWFPVMLSITKRFWDSNMRRLLESSWAMMTPLELVLRPTLTFYSRCSHVGYSGALQENLLEKIMHDLTEAEPLEGQLNEEKEAILEYMMQTAGANYD